jgi:hypothetical protein
MGCTQLYHTISPASSGMLRKYRSTIGPERISLKPFNSVSSRPSTPQIRHLFNFLSHFCARDSDQATIKLDQTQRPAQDIDTCERIILSPAITPLLSFSFFLVFKATTIILTTVTGISASTFLNNQHPIISHISPSNSPNYVFSLCARRGKARTHSPPAHPSPPPMPTQAF